MRKLVLILMAFSLLYACSKEKSNDVLDEQLNETLLQLTNGIGVEALLLPDENDLSKIPQDPKNVLTPEKVELGKLLFHETGIALAPTNQFAMGTFSCASCHFAGAGFQAGRFQGIGDGGIGFGRNGEGRVRGSLYKGEDLDVQPIRSPSVMNTAYQKNMLWNGQFGATGLNEGTENAWTEGTPKENNFLGFEGIETQAIAGLGVHKLIIDSSFIHNSTYKNLFDKAFADNPVSERYSTINAGLSIAAYERIILSNQAPFQKWLKGDKKALSSTEKKGAILFFGKAGCGTCHNSPALNSMDFYALGMADLVDCPEETFKTTIDNPQNLGRGGFTEQAVDNYKFKVPQLYNLKDSPFYGHGASFRTIHDVVNYFNNGVAESDRVPNEQLDESFRQLNLSDEEIDQITAFLSEGLYDNNLGRYEPSSLPSGNCFPNNDPLSKNQLGCN